MADQSSVTFASLLRQHRLRADLTQEELAYAASVSVRSISDLERGVNLTARKETTRLVADALGLTGAERAHFESVARGAASTATASPAAISTAGTSTVTVGTTTPTTPSADPVHASASIALPVATGGVAGATRTLPRDVASFTGRSTELAQLLEAAAGAQDAGVVSIWSIGGMAGVGKTAFAVHAAHQLEPLFPDGQIFLPLHGHTPGQRPVDPADALASLLLTAGVLAQLIPPGLEARSRRWRDHLAGMRLLLVLDDAAGHEQIRPLLPGTEGSLVLVTSRGHLTALEDARYISLDTLPADEAEELLIRLAGRPGIDQGDPSVAEITRLCGYLPLAIGMLARQLYHHPAWTSARLVSDMAATRDRLEFMHVENLSVAAAFDLSYDDLTPDQRQLFRRLGLHPGTEVDAYAAAALDDTDVMTATRHLEALYDQNLITEPSQGRYRLHDLLREHARKLAAEDPTQEADGAISRLLDYYSRAALAASAHMAKKSPGNEPVVDWAGPASTPVVATRTEAVAWMEAERLGLHAAVEYASLSERRRYAVVIASAMHGFLRSFGYWDQALILHQIALRAARQDGDVLAEAAALTDMAEIQQLSGDYPQAVDSLNQALKLFRSQDNRPGQASALNELGVVLLGLADHPAAIASHSEALALYRELGNRAGEASALNELGLVQRATGDYRGAAVNHELALRLYRELGNRFGEASALNRYAQMLRSTGDFAGAAASHEEALAIHRETGNRIGEATALYGLGIVHQATDHVRAAIESQLQALQLARELGYKFGQATALNGLAAAQFAAGDYEAAIASYSEALRLHRELGYRLGQVTALNGLAAAYLRAGELEAATASLNESLRLCEETSHRPGEADARHVLGTLQLAEGDHDAASASLRRALELYTELGVRNGEAEVLNTTGELLLASGQAAPALAHFQRALRIASEIALRAEQLRAQSGVERCEQLREPSVSAQ
ncbi:MAG TPA: tetratricopeptide repeat protein [Streptosporangiaceae bacterium]|jgi:tetratricopeptide (TPR) repeat protein/DNA-binding XRE family transcriptional regulator|nr:tetratricopeptide repeat protein [Streptosporangiaceae bacterium]